MAAALLSPSVRVDLAEIVRDIAADVSRWRPLVRFDETERWYTRLAVADDYEVWLLSWLPGQRTGIHDHGGSAGAFAVAQGQVREDTVDQPWSEDLPGQRVTLSRTHLSTGVTRRFDGRHVHEVVNDGPVPAVTVHAYTPALDSMSRYRLESGILALTTSERAGDDW